MPSKPTIYTSLAELTSVSKIKKFMRDLCTLAELKSFEERFEVAQLIDQGMSYRSINKKTGVSTATITRVAHWLRHGEGGYRIVLGRRQDH